MANRNPLLGNRGASTVGTTMPTSNSFGGYQHPATSTDGAAPGVKAARGATKTINNKSKGRVRSRSRLNGHANRSGKSALLNAMRAVIGNAPAHGVGGPRPGNPTRLHGVPPKTATNVRGGANRVAR